MERLGMALLILGGITYTIVPLLSTKLLSALAMTTGYFLVKNSTKYQSH